MREMVLNRKRYKDIKKMDHNQMNDFVKNIYNIAFEEGKKTASGLTEEETREAILKIKGIGEKKATDIVEALRKAHNEKDMG